MAMRSLERDERHAESVLGEIWDDVLATVITLGHCSFTSRRTLGSLNARSTVGQDRAVNFYAA